jgi:hypothetical protein
VTEYPKQFGIRNGCPCTFHIGRAGTEKDIRKLTITQLWYSGFRNGLQAIYPNEVLNFVWNFLGKAREIEVKLEWKTEGTKVPFTFDGCMRPYILTLSFDGEFIDIEKTLGRSWINGMFLTESYYIAWKEYQKRYGHYEKDGNFTVPANKDHDEEFKQYQMQKHMAAYLKQIKNR